MPAPEPPARIGIFGGTFDPPHVGHVAAARAVSGQLRLDRLLLVVANDPWQKSGERAVSPAEDRYALTEALAEEIPGAEASRLELDRGGPSYSVDTVEEVLAGAGGAPVDLFLVVGADLVPELGTWHRAEDLQRLVTLAIVSRPTGAVPDVPPGWRAAWVNGPQVPVSSSEVRALLAEGRPVQGMVPEPVIHCIRRRALYAVP
ncbi:MAG TPA: nicotinate (nicotinamide) nucleotide adenylyltransferase [Acidimicrobiales bacterium]|nr:nicotinate (nicotinamide) nucleotide adenylyltransferase [Acidimicrobiales bacterium]